MPLPVCVKQTKGPLPDPDLDCPICHEPIEGPEAPTLEHHDGCGRRFDEECLKTWLRMQTEVGELPTCPTCRGPMRQGKLLRYWEQPEEDRALWLRDSRRQRPPPDLMNIPIEGITGVVNFLARHHPDRTTNQIRYLVEMECERAEDMISILGRNSDHFGLEFDILTTRGILGNQEILLHLSDPCFESLWTWSRLFGCSLWYVAQLDMAPTIAFLMPLVPRLNVLPTNHERIIERYYGYPSVLPPSPLVHPPLRTEYVVRLLASRGASFAGLEELDDSQYDFRQVRYIFLCHTVRDTLGTVELSVIAWPSQSVAEGFQRLMLPSVFLPDLNTTLDAWDETADQQFLEAWTLQQLHIFAANTERNANFSSQRYMEYMQTATEERRRADRAQRAADRNEQRAIRAEQRVAELQVAAAFAPA